MNLFLRRDSCGRYLRGRYRQCGGRVVYIVNLVRRRSGGRLHTRRITHRWIQQCLDTGDRGCDLVNLLTLLIRWRLRVIQRGPWRVRFRLLGHVSYGAGLGGPLRRRRRVTTLRSLIELRLGQIFSRGRAWVQRSRVDPVLRFRRTCLKRGPSLDYVLRCCSDRMVRVIRRLGDYRCRLDLWDCNMGQRCNRTRKRICSRA